jgi:hypothetical protein
MHECMDVIYMYVCVHVPVCVCVCVYVCVCDVSECLPPAIPMQMQGSRLCLWRSVTWRSVTYISEEGWDCL